MDGKSTMEWAWRGITGVLIPITLTLAGWVWTMQNTVTNLENDLGDAEVQIAQLHAGRVQAQSVNDDVIAMKKDIEYMKQSLDRIEKAVE